MSGSDGFDLLGGWRCVQFAVDRYCCLETRVVVSNLGSMINVLLDDFCFNVPAIVYNTNGRHVNISRASNEAGRSLMTEGTA